MRFYVDHSDFTNVCGFAYLRLFAYFSPTGLVSTYAKWKLIFCYYSTDGTYWSGGSTIDDQKVQFEVSKYLLLMALFGRVQFVP